MGRDHQPKYRQLERKQGCRAPYDRILIVCEGSKTEPNYFREIRITHRLPTANIIVLPSKLGTAPRQVVECAKEIFESGSQGKIRLGKTISPRSFEQVFAVFDRDDHESYFDALDMAASLDGKLKNDEK
ncbi:MAG: RloB family protein, partial [Azoarcus sp.]|nr:RloB family protein [Azoarcus sp.]